MIDHSLDGAPSLVTRYRMVTWFLKQARARAAGLAALSHERWRSETAFDDLKPHLRGARRVRRVRRS